MTYQERGVDRSHRGATMTDRQKCIARAIADAISELNWTPFERTIRPVIDR